MDTHNERSSVITCALAFPIHQAGFVHVCAFFFATATRTKHKMITVLSREYSAVRKKKEGNLCTVWVGARCLWLLMLFPV